MSEYLTDPIAHAQDFLWHSADFERRYQQLQALSRPTGRAQDVQSASLKPELPPVSSLIWLAAIIGIAYLGIRFSPCVGAFLIWVGGL